MFCPTSIYPLHFGAMCSVCDLALEDRSTSVAGIGLSDVHHTRSISVTGSDYSVDPVDDLKADRSELPRILATEVLRFTGWMKFAEMLRD